MPYKDPEKQRAYKREWYRTRAAGVPRTQTGTQTGTLLPLEFRLRTVADIMQTLEEQVAAVRNDAKAGALEKARAIGYLCSIALRAVETVDLEQRLTALEELLKEDRESRVNGGLDGWGNVN